MGEKKRRLAAGGAEKSALALAERARTALASESYGPALEMLARALALAPGIDALWAQFSELIRFFNFRHPADARLRELLGKALDHPAVDPGDLVRPITSIALSPPAAQVLEDPLLLRLMQETLIRDPALEEIITAARRQMLETNNCPLQSAAAIAHQAFISEYVYDESAEEITAVERLRVALEKEPGAPLQRYAIYGAYRPLSTVSQVPAFEDAALASLARRQIAEPMEERRLRESIASMRETGDAVSAAVREQYEANPYPRWRRTQTTFVPGSVAEIVRELFPNAELAGANPAASRILVAGCGTGQNAIATARRFADASVLAVDLSLASLAYAKRKSIELGIANIEYRRADILALGATAERFDMVECSGVLHHMEDLFAGWAALAGLLKPGGFMRIGLYSELGRRHIVRARELIASEGFAATPEGIRACRRRIKELRADELFAKFLRSEDFYSLSGCRDLLFHVHEERFTLPRIAEMMERLALRFLGFEFPDSGAIAARYRARFADDPALANLDNWHRFEQDHPDSFARMYQFWVRKPL
jgi:2-polyprenyl-3-methyl-5-hydroxy-6-metoxy-1,4-benzoquinol methylase